MSDYLEAVVDEPTFLTFVEALADDRRRADRAVARAVGEAQNGWENDSIQDFLEAGHAWAQDSTFGAEQGLASAAPWKKFAVFLYAGKIYE
ncbi:DUF7660 family protein [Massilia sp. S19_KUP03_FR1]|uniref:DUF7660 family protein n=1 Tax=Massilia sp. S19_KUP03_FR1 TaxID=3025503 RepID=UPI002FCDC07B